MKVAMLTKWPKSNLSNGVAVHVKNLVNELGKFENLDLCVISFGENSEVFYEGKTKIILIKSRKIYYLIPVLAILKLALVVKKINPEIIHIQGSNLSPYLIYMIVVKNYKKVVTYHSFPSLELIAHGRLKVNSLKYKFIRLLEKMTYDKADSIITVTKKIKEWLIEDFGNNRRVFVIYNGVDINDLNYKLKDSNIYKFNLSKEDYIIFHAKSFVPNNGQEYLIKAMPLILQEYPNVKLILAGDGPTKSKLIELCNKLEISNNVLFLGEVPHDEIPLLISASDVIAIPSVQMNGFEEGSSIFLLEAMAMKKPIIASNIGGFRESILNCENGILVPDKDSNAIAQSILYLYKNPLFANSLSENAFNYVKLERKWSRIASETLRIYNSLKD